MTKSELVEQMAKNAGISKSAPNAALNSFTDGFYGADGCLFFISGPAGY